MLHVRQGSSVWVVKNPPVFQVAIRILSQQNAKVALQVVIVKPHPTLLYCVMTGGFPVPIQSGKVIANRVLPSTRAFIVLEERKTSVLAVNILTTMEVIANRASLASSVTK